MKRRQKAGFFSPYAPKSHQQRKRKGEKERARTRKGEEKKKAVVALLVSYNGYFGSSFWPFGGNVFKNIYSSQMKTPDVFFKVFISFL